MGKSIVLGMRERKGKVKTLSVLNTEKRTLQTKIGLNVEVGSTIYTDDHASYKDLGRYCYDHKSVNHSAKEYMNGMAHTNGIESVWAVLKRGYNGTYHNFSHKHLQRYINDLPLD